MKYVGARYVPKFEGTYDATQSYENMSVVDNGMGTSYISQKPVPAGTPLTDTDYWALYGASSGAIVNLQNQINDMQDGSIPGSLQEQINTNASGITALTDRADNINYNFIANKKILIVGDSLSDETVQPPNWVEKLRNLNTSLGLGATIDNLSVSGQGWTSNTPGSGGLIDVFSSVTDIYDIVILFAGVNDYQSQATLGYPSSADRTTFYGALWELHTVLHTKCPSAIVYYCTSPHNMAWTQAQKPIPHNRYRSRAYNACQRFGWLMIDTTVLPNYNLLDYNLYYSDSVHPLTTYAQTLCDHIINAIAAGGETPRKFANKYSVPFEAPYNNSSVDIYFYNDGTALLNVNVANTFPGGNVTVVTSPDGGYVNSSALSAATGGGNVTMYMWPSSIIANIPSSVSGIIQLCFIDDAGYGVRTSY